ncbi:MAG TPA: phosphomevalonate kinase [Microbacteriaceae bacterium]|nr:phosphomevalonate kinase [Microbacteriaceae bacterium]
MIRATAPGKLFVAGEYAVVEPAQPAVLVAVDRYITVAVDPSPTTGAGRLVSTVTSPGRAAATWHRAGPGIETAGGTAAFRYLLAAVAIVEELAAERGVPFSGCRMRVTSTLEGAGRKLGLGSSAAVTVAAVRALGEFYGLGLARMAVLKAALAATFRVAPEASGGDVASSVFGGWIVYASPRREALGGMGVAAAELVTREWPGLCVRHLPAPAGLRLLVGWTGNPAVTGRLVADVRGRAGGTPRDFVAQSRRAVLGLVGALQDGDADRVLLEVRRCRALLAGLAGQTGVAIETPLLAALCDAAEGEGAAAKPSGAGGGDCGIALAPPGADAEAILQEWIRRGIRPLDLRPAPNID